MVATSISSPHWQVGLSVQPGTNRRSKTDEEVLVLCDVEGDGSTKSDKQPVVQSLIERGFIDSSEGPLARVKLTPLAPGALK